MFVDNLDLVVGEQSQLIAAKGLTSENPAKLVARVVKQNRGGDFLPTCKFAYDPTNGTVYVKVVKESDVKRLLVRQCRSIVFSV